MTRTYDALHRETGIAFPTGTPAIARTWDANGNLSTNNRAGGAQRNYSYNELDRLSLERLVVDGRSYQAIYVVPHQAIVAAE